MRQHGVLSRQTVSRARRGAGARQVHGARAVAPGQGGRGVRAGGGRDVHAPRAPARRRDAVRQRVRGRGGAAAGPPGAVGGARLRAQARHRPACTLWSPQLWASRSAGLPARTVRSPQLRAMGDQLWAGRPAGLPALAARLLPGQVGLRALLPQVIQQCELSCAGTTVLGGRCI